VEGLRGLADLGLGMWCHNGTRECDMVIGVSRMEDERRTRVPCRLFHIFSVLNSSRMMVAHLIILEDGIGSLVVDIV